MRMVCPAKVTWSGTEGEAVKWDTSLRTEFCSGLKRAFPSRRGREMPMQRVAVEASIGRMKFFFISVVTFIFVFRKYFYRFLTGRRTHSQRGMRRQKKTSTQ